MELKAIVPVDTIQSTIQSTMQAKNMLFPVGYVPIPSAQYSLHRKTVQLLQQAPAVRPLEQNTPSPFPTGARVLIWKQDPSVAELGTRKSYLPGVVLQGPRDARIVSGSPGIEPVSPNAFGDFIMAPNTDQFDAVHTFAIVRQTLTMYQRALAAGGDPAPLPWQWNSASNTDALQVFPHGLPNVMNAYYSRNDRALKFGDFVASGAVDRMYTCRSLDIVSHEAGHAVLDGLKPNWILSGNPPQTGGLHESFGDLTAIFLTLSQLDQVEAIIAQTRADLHDKTFLSDMAEQFGLALGRANGLRNADNDLKLSEAGTEVHAISQVFTGAIYDILADIFGSERHPGVRDDAAVLHAVADYLRSLLIRALIAAPDRAATYADVAKQMLAIVAADGKPAAYADFIRNRFTVREVLKPATVHRPRQPAAAEASGAVESTAAAATEPTAAAAEAETEAGVEALVVDAPGARQDRRGCCGTMQHADYADLEDLLEQERAALALWCRDYGANGAATEAHNGHWREPASPEELGLAASP